MQLRFASLLTAGTLLASTALSQTINIGGFDSSRCRPFSLSGGNLGYDTVRANLVAASFQATTGCTAILAAETPTATAVYLSDKQVFFVGDGSGVLSAAEAAGISAWHAAGGSLILVGESGSGWNMANSVLLAIGSTSTYGTIGCGGLELITSDDNAVTNGPFGDVRGGGYSTSLTTEILLGGSATALVTCSGGLINYAWHPPGTVNGVASGGVYFMGDPGWFDLFMGNPENLTIALNSFAAMCAGGGGGNLSLQCDPASAHSGGAYVTLANSTTAGLGPLHLEATDGPPGEFGYFLVSLSFSSPGQSISNGMLCLTLPISRYAPATAGAENNSLGQFDAGGVMQNIVGTSTVGSGFDVPVNVPSPVGGTLQAGTTYYFQCWYRDGNRSNFSNVLEFQ